MTMTKEQKDLLFADLCGRLPYGVKCEDIYGNIGELVGIEPFYSVTLKISEKSNWIIDLDNIKPFLLPLSSMSEEQREEYNDLKDNDGYSFDANGNIFTLQDFFNKYHLDYRHLILNKYMAIDATGLNIYK